MDLILFSPLSKPVTPAMFAGWPEHMQREFAALVAEREAELGVSQPRRAIGGISAEALAKARQTRGLFSLNYSEARVSDDEDVSHPVTPRRRAGWKKTASSRPDAVRRNDKIVSRREGPTATPPEGSADA